MKVLTLNCGSSSLKFDLVEVHGGEPPVATIARGSVDRIGSEAICTLRTDGGQTERRKPIADHASALEEAADMLQEIGLTGSVEAAGHRVVHGGSRFQAPALIDETVIEAIEAASQLAPLHNHPALAALKATRTRFGPSMPMVATFDTAFYADLPDVAARYALPRELSERLGIRRYGFHGLAHRYMVQRYRALRPEVEQSRLITLQLGNGCSATASLGGRPLDTSMGFTPLEGLIMGTRSGDLDPSLPFFLARQEGLSLDEVESVLNSQSGLLGLSGRSNDMRALLKAEAAGDKHSALAIEAFCYRVRKYIGAYLSVLGGADALVFGGGISEHSPEIRRSICDGMEWAGIGLDQQTNSVESGDDRLISTDGSEVEAWVIAVDEASIIAQDVARVLIPGGNAPP
jgi:acetate kinase